MQQEKTLWKVTSFEQHIYLKKYPQHSTAQRMTARRSVIHPSFCPSSVLVTVRASKKKKPKLIQTGKSLWPFSRNSGVFCRIPVIFTEIGGRNKKRRSVIISPPMVRHPSKFTPRTERIRGTIQVRLSFQIDGFLTDPSQL